MQNDRLIWLLQDAIAELKRTNQCSAASTSLQFSGPFREPAKELVAYDSAKGGNEFLNNAGYTIESEPKVEVHSWDDNCDDNDWRDEY